MLRGGAIVRSPDGRRWRTRRRWLERPFPNLRRRWRKNKDEAVNAWDLGNGLDALLGGPVIVLVVGAVVVFVLVLGIAFELLAVALLLVSGLVSRVVLRRPWIVEAVDVEDGEERVAFAVEGWRDSGAALRELRTAITVAGPPERLSVGRPLATKPAGR